jgi:hypothetical protein
MAQVAKGLGEHVQQRRGLGGATGEDTDARGPRRLRLRGDRGDEEDEDKGTSEERRPLRQGRG